MVAMMGAIAGAIAAAGADARGSGGVVAVAGAPAGAVPAAPEVLLTPEEVEVGGLEVDAGLAADPIAREGSIGPPKPGSSKSGSSEMKVGTVDSLTVFLSSL